MYYIMEAQLIFERHFTDGACVKWYPDNMDNCQAMDIQSEAKDISRQKTPTHKNNPSLRKASTSRIYWQQHAPNETLFIWMITKLGSIPVMLTMREKAGKHLFDAG